MTDILNDQDTEFIRFENSIKKGYSVAEILENQDISAEDGDWEFLRS